jgi:hypothetical protein
MYIEQAQEAKLPQHSGRYGRVHVTRSPNFLEHSFFCGDSAVSAGCIASGATRGATLNGKACDGKRRARDHNILRWPLDVSLC